MLLSAEDLEVGDVIKFGAAGFTVEAKSPLLRLVHTSWRASPRVAFDEIAGRLREAGELSESFASAQSPDRTRHKRKAKELADSIIEVVTELESCEDLDAPSFRTTVFEVEPNTVVEFTHERKRHRVGYVSRPPQISPSMERDRLGFFDDVTTDGTHLFVTDRWNCRAAMLKLAGVGDGAVVNHGPFVPLPAPMTRMKFDAETGFTYGIQNDPPRLWRFVLYPTHREPAEALHVELSLRKTAFFACLLVTESAVIAAQSPGYANQPANKGGGTRRFTKDLVSVVAPGVVLNPDGCEPLAPGVGSPWAASCVDGRVQFYWEPPEGVPARFQEAIVSDATQTQSHLVLALEEYNCVLVRSIKNEHEGWVLVSLPAGFSKPCAVCATHDQLYVLAVNDEKEHVILQLN